jgi:hypothetical protein
VRTVGLPELGDYVRVDGLLDHHGPHELLERGQLCESGAVGLP